MVTLLIYQNNWKQASQFVSRFNLSPEQFNQAQARAEQLKGSATRAKGQVATVK